MRIRWSTLDDALAEVKAVGDTGGDARSLVDTMADSLAKVGAVGHTRSDAEALVDSE